MNVLILAAGESSSNDRQTHSYPTWLADVDGTLLLERQVLSLKDAKPERFVFLFRQQDVDTYYLNNIVEQIAPGSSVIGLRGETAGAACSALLAIDKIDLSKELIVASATDQIDIKVGSVLERFRFLGADAGVLTFPSLHPRYSYVRTDADGWVVESSEKKPISRSASTGLYWFSKAADFYDGLKEMIIKDAHVQGRFYICPALNELILKQKRVSVFPLSADQYHPLKSDKQVENLEHTITES